VATVINMYACTYIFYLPKLKMNNNFNENPKQNFAQRIGLSNLLDKSFTGSVLFTKKRNDTFSKLC